MEEKKYVEDREDRIYEGICKAERAFALTTIVLDFGFDDPELTDEQISTLKVRNGEIGQLIYTIRDYLSELQYLLLDLQYEDVTAPKVENSDLRYFRKRHGAMDDLEKAHSLISTLQKNYMLDCSELDYEDLQKIKADCSEIATLLSMTDDFICNVLKLVGGADNE